MFKEGDIVEVVCAVPRAIPLAGFHTRDRVIITDIRPSSDTYPMEVQSMDGRCVGYCRAGHLRHIRITDEHIGRCARLHYSGLVHGAVMRSPLEGFNNGDIVEIAGLGIHNPNSVTVVLEGNYHRHLGYAPEGNLVLVDTRYVKSESLEAVPFSHDDAGFVHRNCRGQRKDIEELNFNTGDKAILISDRAGVRPLIGFEKGDTVEIIDRNPPHEYYPDYHISGLNSRRGSGYCYEEELLDITIRMEETG